jgi:hypothetical protein
MGRDATSGIFFARYNSSRPPAILTSIYVPSSTVFIKYSTANSAADFMATWFCARGMNSRLLKLCPFGGFILGIHMREIFRPKTCFCQMNPAGPLITPIRNIFFWFWTHRDFQMSTNTHCFLSYMYRYLVNIQGFIPRSKQKHTVSFSVFCEYARWKSFKRFSSSGIFGESSQCSCV